MKVTCPGCSADFAVDDNRIPPQGLQVRCPRCFKSVEVGGAAAPSSDLEASLGVDLSGPSDEPSGDTLDDGWGAEGPTVPGQAPPPTEGTPGDSGDDWNELEKLSEQDLNLIGTYEKVSRDEPIADDVWGSTAELEQVRKAEAARKATAERAAAERAAARQASQPEPTAAAADGEKPGEPQGDTAASGSGSEDSLDAFTFEGTIGDALAQQEAESHPAEALGGGFPVEEVDNTRSRPLETPATADALPPEPQPIHDPLTDGPGDAFAEFEQDDGSGDAFAEFEQDDGSGDAFAEFEQDDPSGGLAAGKVDPVESFAQEPAPPAAEEPAQTPLPTSGTAGAPDSIFAIEERSGVFKSGSLEPETGEAGEESEVDDGWDLGQLTNPDIAESPTFERETVAGDAGPEGGQPGGAGPTLDDIDFASLLDEAPGKKGPDSEVFFVDSPSVPESDFETAQADDSFSMEEISFDDLDALDEPSQELDAATQSGAADDEDDMFDLDMDPSELDASVPSLDTELPMPDMKTGTTAPPLDRPAPRRRKKKGGIGILLVFIVIIGAGVGAWQLGIFDDLLGNRPKAPLKLQQKPTQKKESASRQLTSPEEYGKRLEILSKDLELSPETKAISEDELLWVLAWYNFLFPDSFPTATTPKKQKAPVLLAQLSKKAGQVFKIRLEAMALGAKGDWAGADKTFQEYLALKSRKMAELLEKESITARVAREDNILSAWLAIENGRYKEAEALLKDLIGEKAGELYPGLLKARLHAGLAANAEKEKDEQKASTERNRAIDTLKKLAQQYPDHNGSKLLLSNLLASQEQLDEAVALGHQVLEASKKAKNYALQAKAYRALALYLESQGKADALFTLLEEMKIELLARQTGLDKPEDLLLKLCELYLERDKVGQALGTLELCGDACSSARYYLLHARAYENSKLLHTAIERAKIGHDKHPKDAGLLLLLARLSRETGQSNSAVAYLEKILQLKPDNIQAALTLANLFLDLKDPPNARKVLLEAERYVHDSLELQEMLAQINEAMGDDPGTISALSKILELKGEDTEVRKKLASYLVRQGNYQEALTHYTMLEEKGLITPNLRADYAKCLRATGRTQDALDVLKELLRDNPGDLKTARFLADIYLQKEDYFNAKNYLEAARRADSKDPEVHFLIGTSCLKLQDQDCALEAFQQAVGLDPEKLEYVEQLANLLFRRAQTSKGQVRQELLRKARKYFSYIITKYEAKDLPVPEDRRNADVYFNHGQILFETGHYEKALVDLDKAMFLAKHRFDMLVAYADTLYKMNRYPEAIKYYQEMIDSKVELAHAYFYLGKIHLVRGKREKAKAYFLQGIGIDPKAYPDAHKHLGDIFREKGLRKKAVDHYRTFLKLVPPNDPAVEEVRSSLRKL